MSKIKEVLELQAPILAGSIGEEHFESKGHTCPMCKGTGWHWQRDGKDYVKEQCDVCHGKGTITAYIAIIWKGE